jgi:hypothetical protein
MTSLAGYKTYLVAAGMGLVVVAHVLGWIDAATFATLLGFLNAAGLATLRAGVQKVEEKVKE